MSTRRSLIKSLIILGTVLLVGGIALFIYTTAVVADGAAKADALNKEGGKFLGDPCPFQSDMSTDARLEKNVISENETTSLDVILTNKGTQPCQLTTTLIYPEDVLHIYPGNQANAPASPGQTQTNTSVPPGQTHLTWEVEPTKLGAFQIHIEVGTQAVVILNKAFGLTVTNVFGLTIWQAQALSYAGSFLGVFLAPVLSITWWYTLWRKRKKRQTHSSSASPPPSQQVQDSSSKPLAAGQTNQSSTQDHSPPPARRRVPISLLVGIPIALLIVLNVVLLAFLFRSQVPFLKSTSPAIIPPSVSPDTQISYPPAGWKLALSDPLNKPSSWQNDSGSGAYTGDYCRFSSGAYHVVLPKGGNFGCLAPSRTFSDFALEVNVTIIRGDCGGIWFRAYSSASYFWYYLFQVCQYGQYDLSLYGLSLSSSPSLVRPVEGHTSPAVHIGLNRTNVLAVVVGGGLFDLFVNHQEVAIAYDKTVSSGQIGFGSQGYIDPNAEVAFSNAKVWTP